MRFSLIPLIFIFSVYLFLGSCSSVLAEDASESAQARAKIVYLGKSIIHPAHPLYFLKKVREVLELKFAPNSEIQAIRYLEFSQRRIREIRSLVEVGRADLIPPTLEHYLFNLQKATVLTDLKNEAKANQLTEIVSIHLQVMTDIYSSIDHEAAKRSLRTAIFKLSEWRSLLRERLTTKLQDDLSDNLAKFQGKICDFLIKEASSSALNEVEIAVLLERVKKCRGL